MRAPPHKAKIVCTLGPSSAAPRMVERLALAGMDAVRLNFSHGTQELHAALIERVRAVSKAVEKPLSLIADLQGPKIRTGRLLGGIPVRLKAGSLFTLCSGPAPGDAYRVSSGYPRLAAEARKGDRILLAEGLIELRVLRVRGQDVRCEVVHGGELGEHKGISLPGMRTALPALTAKDRADLAFALARGADYAAISFVRSAADMLCARAALRRLGRDCRLIAKIEKPEALEDLEAILKVSDGVMVARGDLGVEMSPEKVPLAQKLIITRAREYMLPVITATQMLESMTRNPRPTRAEASDVANAVLDGSGALMLSEETAAGRFPVESVRMMRRIIREAEASAHPLPPVARSGPKSVAQAVSEAVCSAAQEVSLRCIAVFTESGTTARLISQYRPPCPIVGFSPVQATRRRLGLIWGVLPRRIERVRSIHDLARVAQKRLLEEGLARRGDLVGIVAGTPLGRRGTANMLKLHTVGSAA